MELHFPFPWILLNLMQYLIVDPELVFVMIKKCVVVKMDIVKLEKKIV
jgi:hypothetical protein